MTAKKQAEMVRKCMIKHMLIAILAITPLFSHAESYIIEVADFKCKYCREAEEHIDILRNEVRVNDDKFVFAPIDSQAKDETDLIDELFYYAIKDHHPEEDKIRTSLFEMSQTLQLKMNSFSEVVDWLAIYAGREGLSKKSLIEAVNKGSGEFKHFTSYQKANNLIKRHNIKKTPSFILISNKGEETLIMRPPETSIGEYIKITLDAYKRMKESEK